MEPINKIIKTFDQELINTGFSFLSLTRANNILEQKNIITPDERKNNILKILLEENKIPHAYQTSKKPKQWRIPLSENGKKKKEEIENKQNERLTRINEREKKNKEHQFRTVCPNCFANLVIPQELIGQYYIDCFNCGKSFPNPYIRKGQSTIATKGKTTTEHILSNKEHKERPVNLTFISIVSGVFLILVFMLIFVLNSTNSNDSGINQASTSQLLKELRDNYQNHAVTPKTEREIYDMVGGMYPGRRQGPQFYDYDFLEVPISMTLVYSNDQRYYLTFQRGGVKKGDKRLSY